MQPQQTPPAPAAPHDYQFIVNPPTPPKVSRFNLSGGSLPRKLLFGTGGLLVVIILISLLKSLLGGGTNFAPFLSVVQDQQEMIHLSTTATQHQGINTVNKNFAITAQLSLTSAQRQLLTYLKNNHQKVSAKTLNQKVSVNLDNQLTTAAGNSTYDTTFQQIMQGQLKSYQQSLSQAYKNAGVNGKVLLNTDYNGAQLLLQQLASPTS